ncbi:M48 family metallopeptidase [Curtobacterium sp. 9128]|uniref:tetratricopeptide repeat protein n=1 Tax=Curtobacterium sp. 9128 TaxID=1793722 RepID=UPI0011A7C38D|nr:hypothetical protein [Curtobacterium sp. 9128]
MFERFRAHGEDATPHVSPRRLRARTAWADGATAFRAGDWTTAIERFSAAAKDDNEMTDAWLGLHATGHDRGHALLQLQSNSTRLGEEQQRTGITIESRFDIGPYANVPLRSVQDLWAAVGADYLDNGMYSHAQRAVFGQIVVGAVGDPARSERALREATDTLNPTGRYLAGRLEFLRSDIDGALYAFGPLIERGDTLAVSALVMTGTLRAGQGDVPGAMASFDAAVAAQERHDDVSPALAAEALVQSAHLARSAGDDADARDRFARAEALYPHLPGLQHRG